MLSGHRNPFVNMCCTHVEAARSINIEKEEIDALKSFFQLQSLMMPSTVKVIALMPYIWVEKLCLMYSDILQGTGSYEISTLLPPNEPCTPATTHLFN
ncbi:hypothetical protein HPP92_029063 [Vanilla planifolia]|uniref:Uncharacterized protein n=1 Tax=Vanilla planifolia TaxID=51239 RepID=A0A835P522_VANPL|nr:hypothetical protein HPP92_029052 [Vanilla planifolia]KAG0445995.1 hypothetical protein HPP92_029063 [Vanilla planifolia]